MQKELDALVGQEVRVAGKNFSATGTLEKGKSLYHIRIETVFLCIFKAGDVTHIQDNDIYL